MRYWVVGLTMVMVLFGHTAEAETDCFCFKNQNDFWLEDCREFPLPNAATPIISCWDGGHNKRMDFKPTPGWTRIDCKPCRTQGSAVGGPMRSIAVEPMKVNP